jgi:hypothetical protein
MRGRRGAIAGLLLLVTSCSSADYYRMPQTPGAAGSVANEVEYAYFSMAKPRFGLPLAYTEFNPDIDDQVVFFTGVQTRRPTVVLRGVLYRPDGAEQTAFSRTGSPHPRGPYYNYGTDESFPMTALRSHLGRWTLKLFLDDALVGTYEFIVADKAHVEQFRRPR